MGYQRRLKSFKNVNISCVFFSILLLSSLSASTQEQLPEKGWHLLDLKSDGVFGVSMEKTYNEFLKSKASAPVVVAVIDGGVDTDHEDLKDVIFKNKNEIPANGKDDDGNGYIDDFLGWNFLGTSKGSFQMDNMEDVRQLRKQLKTDPDSRRADSLKLLIYSRLTPLKAGLKQTDFELETLNGIIRRIGKTNPTEKHFRDYKYKNFSEERLLVSIVKALKGNSDFLSYKNELEANNKRYKDNVFYQLNIDYNPRSDREFKNKFYGNFDSKGPNPFHGTHAAGIIAASRYNNLGIKGVADKVMIMPVRVVPDGGEVRDEDIAVAIRYAVDNGAKVINMSFGQSTSGNKLLVDEAVKYAGTKDVLIVHAAGNLGVNLDEVPVYPNKRYLSGGESDAWIEVGASNYKDNKDLLAWFSNYSKTKVDVCAPGVSIYSTWPGNKYEAINGTSMATPIVAGVAGMLRAYFPKLTAVQIRDVIVKSVVKIKHNVIINTRGVEVPFEDVCRSGGIVNAYNAFKLASEIYK